MPVTSNSLSRVLALASGEGKLDKTDPRADYGLPMDPAQTCLTCSMSTFNARDPYGECSAVAGPIDRRDACRLWDQRKVALAGGWQHPGLSPGFVEGYERLEKGKLERVSGYPRQEADKLKLPRSYVAELPGGHMMEVDAYKLWLHKDEGKPGPRPQYSAGQKVTWRHKGKMYEAVIRGTPGDPAFKDKFTPVQNMFTDAQGNRHWGLHGGAGLLLHHTDDNNVTRYLLQRRSHGVQAGGTYSTPGGAIDKPGGITETPEAAAFREAEEEGWGNLLKNATVTGVKTEHFGGEPGAEGVWSYHTVSASLPDMTMPSGKGTYSNEATGAKWATPEEMAKLPLHPDFLATANALGRPADVPNPAPAQPKYAGNVPRHPLVKDDYKPGQRVTWRKGGENYEGFVQGWANEAKIPKGKLPTHYNVKEAKTGDTYEVRWEALRLHPSEDPKAAKKAEQWEKDQQHKVTSSGAGKSYGTGYGAPPAKGDVLKAHSLSLPGLTHQVPAKIHDAPVTGVLEHPKRTHLLVITEGDGWAAVRHGKIIQTGSGFQAGGGAAKAFKEGWKSLPVSPPQKPDGGSSSLGKVIEAANVLR